MTEGLQETVEKLGGKITKMEVPYTMTKLTVLTAEDRWEGVGGETVVFTVEVGSEANMVELYNATYAAAKAVAVDANKARFDDLLARYSTNKNQAPGPQPVATAPTPKPQPQQSGMLEDSSETFEVDTITVEFSPKGAKYAKAKGGKWGKYGVTVWPEVLIMEPLEWDLEQMDAQDYPAPKGLTAIVYMEDGKPKKVTGWA